MLRANSTENVAAGCSSPNYLCFEPVEFPDDIDTTALAAVSFLTANTRY